MSPNYPASVLGRASGDGFYMAVDFIGQLCELAFIVGTISTRSGIL
jgi:hypothetical protein